MASTEYPKNGDNRTNMNANNKQLQTLAFAVVGAMTAIVVILLASNSGELSSSGINYDDIQQYRTADGAYVLGDPDSAIAIVEFADFLCPHCQTYKDTIDDFVKEYVVTGQARLEYRFVPTQQNSAFVASLSECVYQADSSKFWEAHDELFVMASNNLSPSDMREELADKLDISDGALIRCTTEMSEDQSEQFLIDQALGRTVGVTGTPTIRVRYGDDNAPLESLGQNSPPLETLAGAVILGSSPQ
jgi:protein-disulfide isomerase